MTSFDYRSPQELLADRSWRLRHSLWVLVPLVTCGILTWAAFVYIGVRARRPAWWIAGIVYAVLTGVAFALTVGQSTADPTGVDAQGALTMIVFLGGTVHAVLVNRAWLRWRSEHNTPWYLQADGYPQPAGNGRPPSFGQPSDDGTTGYGTTGYGTTGYGTTGAYPSGPAPAPPWGSPTGFDPAPVRVDVNEADRGALQNLPGMTPERVSAAVAERARRGGFRSLEEFASVVGLAPHELMRIRQVACCSTPHSPDRPSSR
jgi:Helix-hairpin-helix motif